jgi:NAD(P)-dependent dehydrogenase (short-subunit alcohol dehydrogenase family)
MARFLEGRAVLVTGDGDEAHRAVVVALAEAGADVAIAGPTPDLAAEAALHSIANEVWAIGRRSTVVKLEASDDGLAGARQTVESELGRCELIVRCEAVS